MKDLNTTVENLIKFLDELKDLNAKLQELKNAKAESLYVTARKIGNSTQDIITLIPLREIFYLGLDVKIKEIAMQIETLIENRIKEVKEENSTENDIGSSNELLPCNNPI